MEADTGDEAGSELPGDVVQAIMRGRKIEAIKLLRLARGIDLKEAKDAVDRYIARNTSIIRAGAATRSETGVGRVVLIIIALLALAGGYFLLGGG